MNRALALFCLMSLAGLTVGCFHDHDHDRYRRRHIEEREVVVPERERTIVVPARNERIREEERIER